MPRAAARCQCRAPPRAAAAGRVPPVAAATGRSPPPTTPSSAGTVCLGAANSVVNGAARGALQAQERGRRRGVLMVQNWTVRPKRLVHERVNI